VAPGWAADDAPETYVWDLRDKYTFDGPAADLAYAVDYGEWRVVAPALGEVFSNIGCEVVLADGTVLRPRDCGKAESTRDRASSRLGEGIAYITQCPAKDGLKITHKMASYKDRSGLTIHLELENVGTTPIQIKALHPLVAKAGNIKQVKVEADAEGGPYVFTNAAEKVTVLIGRMPLGGAPTTLQFKDEGTGIVGGAISAFDPPKTLAPGERLEADPVMIMFSYEDPAKTREFFGYAHAAAAGTLPAPQPAAVAAPAPAPAADDKPEKRPAKGRARRYGR
jgi:hypothetical protein